MGKICDNCIKKEVCKYIEQIKEFEKNKKEENKPNFIEIKYSCKYKNNGGIFRTGD